MRTQKTKKKLTDALTQLLQSDRFEHISVTDLCKTSGVSRITFYAYYDDKYQLVAALFDEMYQTAAVVFQALEKAGNPEHRPVVSCCHLLNAIFDMQEQYQDLTARLLAEENPYLAFAYYWYVLRQAEEHVSEYLDALDPVHPLSMTASMLCTGLWGFIREGFRESRPRDEIRAGAEAVLYGFLCTPSLFRAVVLRDEP